MALRSYVLLGILLNILAVHAGNSWIHYNQQYYKFPITTKGIYRISYSDLQSTGVSTGDFDPRNLQIFRQGTEIPLYVHTEGDGIFQSDDYIEFVAFPNDGTLDSSYYKPGDQLNPYYSLYNDTAWYFLTWNNSLKNARFGSVPSAATGSEISYCFDLIQRNFTNRFNYPESLPNYGPAEGYTSATFGQGSSKTESFTLTNYAPSAGVNTSCEYSLASVSSFAHKFTLAFAGKEISGNFYGHRTARGTISASVPADGKTSFTATISTGDYAIADAQAFAYLRVIYPRTLVSKSDSLTDAYLPKSGTGQYKSVIFSGLRNGNAVMYDLTGMQRFDAIVSDNSAQFIASNTEMSSVFISVDGASRTVIGLKPIGSNNSQPGKFADFTLSGNQAQYVIITHKSLWDAAQEYADYRSQTGLKTKVIDIDEIYNQFGYGVQKHPLGLHDFAQYAFEKWNIQPEYFFIIGKGIHAVNFRNNAINYSNCLVPSAGSPSADMMIFSGIGGAKYSQAFAVGRLAARSPAAVRSYLQKVQQHEQQEQAEWMKTVLHFGGGSNTSEQQSFKLYLAYMESIIEGDLCGATLYTTLKNSSDPLEITKTDMVRNKIEGGVNMMNFFGHASSGSFDQSIDEPTYFNNKGKYPFILANSCYTGDIFTPESASISERWILIENKGAIGFAASVGTGQAHLLNSFSTQFYTKLSTEYYGKSIAQSIQATVNTFVKNSGGELLILSSTEMNLHGDPAVSIHSASLPDLLATEASIIFSSSRITADADSFSVYVSVLNIGKTFSDTVEIELTRKLPNGNTQTQIKQLQGLQYRDTIAFTFATGGIPAGGSNRFDLLLDKSSLLPELSETNNATTVVFTIYSRQLVPVYPEEFAIVPSTDLTLSASALDPSGFGDECYFEIDTDHNFNSPGKQSMTLPYDNSLIRWKPEGLQPDITYYWRVGTRKKNDVPVDWNASSFRIETGKTGWAQYGYGQAQNNAFTYCGYDNQEKLNFITTRQMLTCVTVGSASNDLSYNQTQFRIDGVKIGSSGCFAYPYITVAVIDPVTLQAWDAKSKNFGHHNYSSSCIYKHDYFEFSPTNEAQKTAFVNFINDSVPTGHYILVYTFISGRFKSWNENMYAAMEQLGASSVRSQPDSNPYIFFVKKGDPKSAREVPGETSTETIELNVRLESNAQYGWMETPSIGPAPSWENALWNWDLATTDSANVQFIGVQADGTQTILADTLVSGSYDLSQLDLHAIKIRSYISDAEQKTPPTFDHWKVYYTPIPETAINIKQNYLFHADTLVEGDSLRLSIATENVSHSDMDSLLVRYILRDKQNNLVQMHDQKLAPHAAGSIAIGDMVFATAGMSGGYRLKAEFNPDKSGSNQYDQPERYHFNNVFEKPFVVTNDGTNPLLTVKFDGARILDGEIVSAKPTIEIEVFDENKYFLLDDTSRIEVYIRNSTLKSSDEQRIYFIDNFGAEQIRFTPATAESGKASLIYSPTFTQDGTYTLRVKAWDAKGNTDESADYMINFQIINRSTITHIFNYPNPFSTSTRFIFTITGSQLPDDMRIQIMTVSGKLVREITMAELGPLRIGNNITQYAWDGTDKYGDRLANGVYFYRVFNKLNGTEIEHRNSAADNMFKKGYGKMVLFR